MKKPYTNNTGRFMHIGNVTLMPGQTRDCDERDILVHTGTAAEKQAAAPTEPKTIGQLREDSVKNIKKKLPELTGENLDDLEKAENADNKPRVSLLEAITEERLKRATHTGDGTGKDPDKTDMQLFIESLPGCSDEELLEYVELYTGDDANIAYLEAINTEIENRAAGSEA